MKTANTKTKIILAAAFISLMAMMVACGGSKTNSDTDAGDQYVSNGGSGSKLVLELEDATEIPTGGKVGFRVLATDPKGAALSHIRIFCETEKGIAIIEPSSGGVAFESTNDRGGMSGVIGGVSPGSFLMECRAPEGFNLVVRKSFRVVGDIPAGFVGFPGAAGGNLGGGVINDPTSQNVTITQVTFTGTGVDESRVGDIDIVQDADCDGDITTVDPEPFSADNFNAEFVNGLTEKIFVQSVEIKIYSGSTLVDTSVEELGGLIVSASSSTTLTGVFTEVILAAGKSLAGSRAALIQGTYNINFTFTYETEFGETGTVSQNAAIRIGNFNNC